MLDFSFLNVNSLSELISTSRSRNQFLLSEPLYLELRKKGRDFKKYDKMRTESDVKTKKINIFLIIFSLVLLLFFLISFLKYFKISTPISLAKKSILFELEL